MRTSEISMAIERGPGPHSKSDEFAEVRMAYNPIFTIVCLKLLNSCCTFWDLESIPRLPGGVPRFGRGVDGSRVERRVKSCVNRRRVDRVVWASKIAILDASWLDRTGARAADLCNTCTERVI